MNGTNSMQPPVKDSDLRKYEEGWTREMSVYWRERMLKLGVYDTGALYRSVTGVHKGDTIEHRFLEYGINVAAGVDIRYKKNNGGDLDFLKGGNGKNKQRKKRDWFSRKYYSSVMRLSEFEASYYGQAYNGLIATALQDIFESNGIVRNL